MPIIRHLSAILARLAVPVRVTSRVYRRLPAPRFDRRISKEQSELKGVTPSAIIERWNCVQTLTGEIIIYCERAGLFAYGLP
jgi:hypothetical protein